MHELSEGILFQPMVFLGVTDFIFPFFSRFIASMFANHIILYFNGCP